MGFFDRLFGTEPQPRPAPAPAPEPRRSGTPGLTPPPLGGQDDGAGLDDRQAIERYRYLLRTAPPETIEQVHAEAFARLTEPQRQQVLADLSGELPASERPSGTEPGQLARAATRAEYTNPGFMERTLGGNPRGQGPGFGSMVGGSLLGTVAGYVIGSALVSSFMAPMMAADSGEGDSGSEADAGSADAGGSDAAGADAGGFDGGGFDAGGFDAGGMDFGGFDGF